MKFLKTSIALLVVFGITIAAKDYGFQDLLSKSKHSADQIEKPKVQEEVKTEAKSIFEQADSICQSIGVPFELVKEIGQNESGWRCVKSATGGTDFGDLQVIDVTFNYWYNRLGLTGGKTRLNYLIVGIHYLKYNHDRYGSWRKARFAYGRGSWRDESTWTDLEKKFMGKIDWTKYDSPAYVLK